MLETNLSKICVSLRKKKTSESLLSTFVPLISVKVESYLFCVLSTFVPVKVESYMVPETRPW